MRRYVQDDNIATCIRIESPVDRRDGTGSRATVILSNQSSLRIRNRRPRNPPSFFHLFLLLSLLRVLPPPYPSCKDDSAVSQRPAVFSELPFNASPAFPAAGKEEEGGRRKRMRSEERKRKRNGHEVGGRKGVWSMLAKIGF